MVVMLHTSKVLGWVEWGLGFGNGNGTDLASVSSLWKNWWGSLLQSFFTIIFILSEPMLALWVGSADAYVCMFVST